MTRAERIEAALVGMVRDRAPEINALLSVRSVGIILTFDESGCVELEQVRYESKNQRRRGQRASAA